MVLSVTWWDDGFICLAHVTLATKTLGFWCDLVPRGHSPSGDGGTTTSKLHTCSALLPPPAGLLPVCLACPGSSFILPLPWLSFLGEADSPEASVLHLRFPLHPSAKSLSASLRLTVFSNPEQSRRCSQGREVHHQLSSEPACKGGAAEIRQPLRPSGLCSPSVP